jgi:hypothetical protein
MADVSTLPVPALTMEDELGIVYVVENAPQFWSGTYTALQYVKVSLNCVNIELDDILRLPREPTLQHLDGTLKRYLALCSAYHGQHTSSPASARELTGGNLENYLQTPLQLEHACELLIGSELFAFHSERMCDILVENLKSVCILT